MRKTGYNPPKPDERDIDAHKLYASKNFRDKARGEASLMYQVVEVLDQKSIGSCTANGIAQLIRMRERNGDITLNPKLGSRLFIYYHARYIDDPNNIDFDTGSDPRSAMKSINRWGLPPERDWPYEVSDYARVPNGYAYRHAHDNREPYSYYWIKSEGQQRVEDVKLALDAGYAVGIGTNVNEEYSNWKAGDKPLNAPSYGGSGHFMVLTGYLGDVFDCLGSWGVAMGDHGYWQFSEDYIASTQTSTLLVIEKGPVL